MNNYPTYLIHFGIIGQKWGDRKYQYEDGSLTPAGRIRYGINGTPSQINRVDVLKERKKYRDAKKDYSESLRSKREASKNIKKKYSNYIFKKKEYLDKKDRYALQKRKKDKRQLKFEEEYMSKGLKKKDAELQAYKRRKTEKILAATAAVTVAAIAAYAAHKVYKYNHDTIIKKGTKFHHIVDGDFRGVEDAFVSRKTIDRAKYKGWYSHELNLKSLRETGKSAKLKDVTIEAQKDMKIISRKNARKTLEEVFKENPEAYKEFKNKYVDNNNGILRDNPKKALTRMKAMRDLEKGKVTDAVYDTFNMNYLGPQKQEKIFKEFNAKLNKKGYSAILDMNDYKYSSYHSKEPLILIDKNKGFKVSEVKDMPMNKTALSFAIASGEKIFKKAAPIAVVGTAANAATVRALRNRRNNELVAQYQREHPGTKKTYNEILRDIYKRM